MALRPKNPKAQRIKDPKAKASKASGLGVTRESLLAGIFDDLVEGSPVGEEGLLRF